MAVPKDKKHPRCWSFKQLPFLWLLSTSLLGGLVVTVPSSSWVHRREEQQHGTYYDKPTLLLGLPKSGSEAIHEFLVCMNVVSYHYCCGTGSSSRFPCQHGEIPCGTCVHENLKNKREDPFHGCVGDHVTSTEPTVFSQFDIETKEPFSWFLPQRFALPLLEEHSGLWILNTRGQSKDWATHVLHWHSITQRLFHALDLYGDDEARKVVAPINDLSVEFIERELQQSLARAKNVTDHQRRHDSLANAYERHSSFVRTFAKRSQHTLLEINVDGDPEQTSLALAEAFRLDPRRARQCWNFDPKRYGDGWREFELNL